MLLSTPEAFQKLFSDPLYISALTNTAIFIVGAVPLKMALAVLLSGFLSCYGRIRIVKVLNVLFLLPWAIPAVASALSVRWTLNYDYGILNKIITDLGFAPVGWLQNYPTAMLTVIVYHLWHWLPMWTLMLTAGRKNIPEELYEAASIDGASLRQHFTAITAPLLSKLFFICVLLSSIWSLGEFEAVWLVTMTDPNQSTNIISTLGYSYTFVHGNLVMGLACYMSMLPIIVIILVILMYLMRGTR